MSGKVRAILSPAEVGDLKEEKKTLEHTLRALDDAYGEGTKRHGMIDRANITKQIKGIDERIKMGMPQKVVGSNKDKFAGEVKKLREQILQGMPTQAEMWPTKDNRHPGAALKHHNWEKRCAPHIARYKYLMRRLEPDNPSAGNIEELRRR